MGEWGEAGMSPALEQGVASSGSARASLLGEKRRRGRKGQTARRVADAEAASGDTAPAPKVDVEPQNGCATVWWCTVARSRACHWHAMACLAWPVMSKSSRGSKQSGSGHGCSRPG